MVNGTQNLLEVGRNLRGWMLDHIATSSFIIVHIVLTIIRHFIPLNAITILFLNIATARDTTYMCMNIIFLLLFSGVEVTIGRNRWFAWMSWTAVFLLGARLFLGINSIGPTFVVFAQYLSFVVIHKPFLYFKILRFRFTDTLLYSIGILQYVLNDTSLAFDFIICTLSNLIWRIVTSRVTSPQPAETQDNPTLGQQLDLSD